MSALRCLKMRLSDSKPSMSSTTSRKGVSPCRDVLDELDGEILMHAADAEILGMHMRQPDARS